MIVRGSIVGTEFLHSSAKSAGFQQFRWQEREGEEVLVDGGESGNTIRARCLIHDQSLVH